MPFQHAPARLILSRIFFFAVVSTNWSTDPDMVHVNTMRYISTSLHVYTVGLHSDVKAETSSNSASILFSHE